MFTYYILEGGYPTPAHWDPTGWSRFEQKFRNDVRVGFDDVGWPCLLDMVQHISFEFEFNL